VETLSSHLADAGKCGVYQSARKPEEIERAAKVAGLAVFRIDIGRARDKKDLLARVANALHFPEWFGGNLDSLHDCLTDLDWLPAKSGYVLLFENSAHFGERHQQEFDDALAVLSAAAEYWKKEGRPFWALIQASQTWDAGLPTL
jgi:RNAse (barnase) inhibitor barstar